MKVLTATLALLVSSAAAAQECQTCSMADACIKTYLKSGVGGPKGHERGNPGLEAESGQKGLHRIFQQGHDRTTIRHGVASSFGA
jgi:hypothetical protein